MSNCPCGLEVTFSECCEPLIKGKKKAATAEQLMRSRYSAFVKAEVQYLVDSTHPDQRGALDEDFIRQWSEESEWLGLEVLETEGGGEKDSEGVVNFRATYKVKEDTHEHLESAYFEKVDGDWYFDHDRSMPPELEKARQVGRNEPCTCGSGKKYKKCCGKA